MYYLQAKEFGRSVHIDEVFQQTHIRKETGQFVDERSSKTYEDFVNKFSQAMSEATSSVDESHLMDPGLEDTIRSKCWSDAVGGITTKGRLYGAGDLARHLKDTESSRIDVNLKRKASCSSSHDTEDIVQLKQRLAKNEQRLAENDAVIRQLQQFQSIVLQFLPTEAQTVIQNISQQQNMNLDQQNGEQHQNQQEDDQDKNQEDSPNYEDY
ncbi:uncharacterized protein LOC109807137 [Cajanus cajan]|uniref:uncharacterized protein LOC109807137 n=1 Tax=Cajanus cajan TaxID=3821 RepID=UPI0010FAD2F4|nr:uncharacterized protein LOC109807137 [Cajanus cajan]